MESDVERIGNWNSRSWAEGHGPLGYFVFYNSPEKKPVQDRFKTMVEDFIDELNNLYTVGILFFDDPVGLAQAYMPKALVAYAMDKHGYTLSEIAIALEFKNTTAVWRCSQKVKELLVDIEEVCLQMKDDLKNAHQANPADHTILVTLNVLFYIWCGKQPEVIMNTLEIDREAFDRERVKLRKLATAFS